uniref:Cytochrome P450 n=1 Tax=Nothapodytes nimmoniana TaxID=159386 RepID=A0A7L7RBB5_NOTNI|nr:cytochrome P450 [Nothapodytes nimmoniana]
MQAAQHHNLFLTRNHCLLDPYRWLKRYNISQYVSQNKMTTSLAFPCLQPRYISSANPTTSKCIKHRRPIVSTLSGPKNPSTAAPLPNREPVLKPEGAINKLPTREIPGDYGWPFIGPIKDRLDYFYNQGIDGFFKSRVQKYDSTVFRANMPPGPFISSNSKVIVLVDGKSFPILFDVSKVEKKDLFSGTYMPSTELTGGYRILSYLDPSEQRHSQLKQLIFFLLKSRRDYIIPEFHKSYTEMFESLEKEISTKGKVDFGAPNDQAAFNFLARAFFGANPADTKLGSEGPNLITIWVFFQLSPILTVGLPRILEEPLFHTFSLPPFLIKGGYQKLYDFFYEYSGTILEEGEKLGVPREEACHNILFATCFNTFGGMKILFPSIINHIGQAGVNLQSQLGQEIRSVVKSNGGKVTLAALEQMPLTKSVVYECFRIEPPVPYQYAKAKQDLIIESHDAAFQVKKGEMLFGFQPFATKDAKVFERAEEFVGDRFVGEGEKLLKYVLWSNGPETESPTLNNKQCAGKNFVVLVSRLLVVEFFLLYDTFDVNVRPFGSTAFVDLTSIKRASF